MIPSRTCTVCGGPGTVFDGEDYYCSMHGWGLKDEPSLYCEPGCIFCREDRGEPAFARLKERAEARVAMIDDLRRDNG